jgi:lipopolysaccharide export system permease protein
MKIPLTLSYYIIKQFLVKTVMVFAVLASVVLLLDLLEILRRSQGKGIPYDIILQITFLKLPYLLQQLIPFIILISTSLTFSKMSRNSELIVARSAGISGWQFTIPVVLTALIIGVVSVTVYNPLSSSLLDYHMLVEAKHMKGKSSVISVTDSGIWLRDHKDGRLDKIIHANSVYDRGAYLSEVTIFIAGDDNSFVQRIYADVASIQGGKIIVTEVVVSAPSKYPQKFKELALPTQLVSEQLQENLAEPNTISIWELPSFIHRIEGAGFSALNHLLHFYNLLLSPLFLCAIVLITASFSLSQPRRGRIGVMIVVSVAIGVLIYFFSKLVHALGLSGSLNAFIAALIPVVFTLFLGVFTMFHYEDG